MMRLVHALALIGLPVVTGLRKVARRQGHAAGEQKMVAFIENWLECPTLEQIQGYTHVVISFAVSYSWAPGKNECDEQCRIGAPVPICGDWPGNPQKVKEWQDAGVKVILSFGGAGQGGSWAGDKNDCWEDCFRVGASDVASQLATIVADQGFDGVDIDYEYFVTQDVAAPFLSKLTTDLQELMPAHKTVSHAPMDRDIDAGDVYYEMLKSISSSVDYVLPQYYNGFISVKNDPEPAYTHFSDLVHDMFGDDASKVVFGFCTGWNNQFCTNGTEAAEIMRTVTERFPKNGGAFFWAGAGDRGNVWSGPVRDVQLASGTSPLRGVCCLGGCTNNCLDPRDLCSANSFLCASECGGTYC